jgi:hypothetical protein
MPTLSARSVFWLPDQRSPRPSRAGSPVAIVEVSLPGHSGGTAPESHRLPKTVRYVRGTVARSRCLRYRTTANARWRGIACLPRVLGAPKISVMLGTPNRSSPSRQDEAARLRATDIGAHYGFRHVEHVHIATEHGSTVATVTGVVHRYPRSVRVPLRVAAGLVAAGAPFTVHQAGAPPAAGGI